jgi:pyrroline-5-carboxylate reductase
MKAGFIGGGKMAEAIIADLAKSGIITPENIFVYDISSERRDHLHRQYKITILPGNRAVPTAAKIVFLAVKPQNQDEVLREIADSITPDHIIISIAAGRHISNIAAIIPHAKIVRVMPNLAATVSQSMNAFCTNSNLTEADTTIVTELLSCFGKALQMPEEQFDAITALSGSGPAFFAYFTQAMADAGTNLGLSTADAAMLAKQTLLGTATLLAGGSFEPNQLIDAVSSAKGTTAAGMEVLHKSSLRQIVGETLKAAADRSRELSR